MILLMNYNLMIQIILDSKNVNNNNLKNYDYNSNKMNEQPPQN